MRRRTQAATILVAGVGMMTITACGGPTTTATKTVTETKLVTITATAAPTSSLAPPPAPTGPATSINGDGTYVVGADFAPGVYKSSGPSGGSPMCSWARLNRLSSITDIDAVILNGNNTGQGFVTIEPSDVAFASQSCQTWQKVD